MLAAPGDARDAAARKADRAGISGLETTGKTSLFSDQKFCFSMYQFSNTRVLAGLLSCPRRI
jgi:hypothetical protein